MTAALAFTSAAAAIFYRQEGHQSEKLGEEDSGMLTGTKIPPFLRNNSFNRIGAFLKASNEICSTELNFKGAGLLINVNFPDILGMRMS